ncbi:hypothetical protein BASA81_015741 [Batrachochytrium salamandrivorans]|nr:hypothetical protein BASA81_015741 [Batrachochytrium salamandrivorans]
MSHSLESSTATAAARYLALMNSPNASAKRNYVLSVCKQLHVTRRQLEVLCEIDRACMDPDLGTVFYQMNCWLRGKLENTTVERSLLKWATNADPNNDASPYPLRARASRPKLLVPPPQAHPPCSQLHKPSNPNPSSWKRLKRVRFENDVDEQDGNEVEEENQPLCNYLSEDEQEATVCFFTSVLDRRASLSSTATLFEGWMDTLDENYPDEKEAN